MIVLEGRKNIFYLHFSPECKKGRADFILDDVFDPKPLAILPKTSQLLLIDASVDDPEMSSLLKVADLGSVIVVPATKMFEVSPPPKNMEVKGAPRIIKTCSAATGCPRLLKGSFLSPWKKTIAVRRYGIFTFKDPYSCMTKSSKKELVKPYEEPKRVLHSTRKLSKTTSLDYSSSPEFELFSNHKVQFEEEITETMREPTMEEYMMKTQEDYGLGIARPKFEKDAKFELKGQFLKELRENNSKDWMIKMQMSTLREFMIADLFTTPHVTQDQLMLRVFPISLTRAATAIQAQLNNLGREIKKVNERVYDAQVGCELCNGPHYTKDCPLKEEGKTLEEAYYTQFEVPFPQAGRYRAEVLREFEKLQVSSTEYTSSLKRLLGEKWRIEEEIKMRMNEHCSTIVKDTLPPKEKDLGSFTLPRTINNMCFDKALADLGASVSVMPYSTFTNLGLGKLALIKLIIELAYRTVKRPKGLAKNVLVGIDKFVFLVDFIILDMPEDSKTSLILGRPFLSTTHAKIDVFNRKFVLRVGNDKIVFKSDTLTSHIVMKVYVLGLRERMELDLEARLMGEALILNRSEDPDFGDFIELNDLNEPLELRNHEIEDLVPKIKEGEVIDEPKVYIVQTRDDDIIVENIDEYSSLCDYDRKIKDNFVKNMDAYRDKDMGDVIFGKPFCRSVYVEARWFDGFITVSNGNDSVTYQMARSHPRFKHLSNEQCNKIRALLQVSARDKLKGKSHPYQILKDLYKGVLDLGPEYIRDEKIVEWLTRGHVSMHEMDCSEASLT
ncbi:DNA/RNA polymerases superfamily protein [Tanacetum coccineum]